MESFLLATIHTLYFVEQPAAFLPTQKNALKRSVKKWTNNTKSGPCLEISCATIFQPRIPPQLIWCILHTAYTLFPGTDLKLLNTTRHLIYESYITCVFVFSLFMYLYYIYTYTHIYIYIGIYYEYSLATDSGVENAAAKAFARAGWIQLYPFLTSRPDLEVWDVAKKEDWIYWFAMWGI
jgi:hypothetical protein